MGAKTVFVVFAAEQIFDLAVNPQRVFIFAESEPVTGRQIGVAVSVKAVDIRAERRIAKDRSKVIACRQQIEIHPKLFVTLGRDKGKLAFRNAERGDDAAAADLRFALVAVRICVRREHIGRTRRVNFAAKFAAACDAAFGVQISAAGIEIIAAPRIRLGKQTITDRAVKLCIKINRRKLRVPFRKILVHACIKCRRAFRF